MKRFIPILSFITTIFFFQPLPTYPIFAESNVGQDTEKELIIFYSNEAGKKEILEHSEQIDYEFNTIPALSATVSEDSIEYLEENPNIEYIEENIIFSISESHYRNQLISNKPLSLNNYLWNISKINVPYAWDEGLSGEKVKVAVMDTGISHSNLSVVGGISTVDYTNSWLDDHGHGTHIAGIIAAQPNLENKVTGIAPNVELYSVKVLDNQGYGTLQDILEGIDWAIENDIDVINMSLGTDQYSKSLEDLINEAINQEIIIVAATGNKGIGSSVEYPAKFNNVISVSSVSESLTISSFSSTGDEVDFAAPGENILSTYINGYKLMQGSSQATPHVSGILALLKERYPEATNEELYEILKDSSIDLGTIGKDPYYGHGLVQYPVNNKGNEQLEEPGQPTKKPEQPTEELKEEPDQPEQISYRGIALKEKTNVYKEQSTDSNILKSYKQGTILKYKSLNENWYEATVYVNGKPHTGYIYKNDVENIITPQKSFQGIALNTKTPVYQRASKDSKILKTYSKGSILKYKSLSSQWYEATVYVNGKKHTGYIYKDDVENGNTSTNYQGFALKDSTKVYSKANKSSKALKSYPKARVLKYTSFTSDWYQATVYVKGKKQTGYIHKYDVANIHKDKQTELRTVALNNKVNVYMTTSRNSNILKNYSHGSILKVRTYSKDWFEATVYVNGKKHTGYIAVKDVEITDPQQRTLSSKAKEKPTRVYQKATRDSKVLKSYTAGRILKYRTFSENWYEATVYVKGKKYTGYINTKDVY